MLVFGRFLKLLRSLHLCNCADEKGGDAGLQRPRSPPRLLAFHASTTLLYAVRHGNTFKPSLPTSVTSYLFLVVLHSAWASVSSTQAWYSFGTVRCRCALEEHVEVKSCPDRRTSLRHGRIPIPNPVPLVAEGGYAEQYVRCKAWGCPARYTVSARIAHAAPTLSF